MTDTLEMPNPSDHPEARVVRAADLIARDGSLTRDALKAVMPSAGPADVQHVIDLLLSRGWVDGDRLGPSFEGKLAADRWAAERAGHVRAAKELFFAGRRPHPAGRTWEVAYPTADKMLPLDQIVLEDEVRSRAELCTETVNPYAEDMLAGRQFPPVDVFFDGQTYRLASGFLRYHATRQAGRPTIAARVYRGGFGDATLFAAGSNAGHGLPRSNADKQRAVKMALRVRPDWSNTTVARWCGVTDKTVGKHRGPIRPDLPDRIAVAVPPTGTFGNSEPGIDPGVRPTRKHVRAGRVVEAKVRSAARPVAREPAESSATRTPRQVMTAHDTPEPRAAKPPVEGSVRLPAAEPQHRGAGDAEPADGFDVDEGLKTLIRVVDEILRLGDGELGTRPPEPFVRVAERLRNLADRLEQLAGCLAT